MTRLFVTLHIMKHDSSLMVRTMLAILFLCVATSVMSQGFRRDSLMVQRMLHYADNKPQIDSLSTCVYYRYVMNIVRRNFTLLCVPTMYNVARGKDREHVGESVMRMTFYGPGHYKRKPISTVSTARKNRTAMPNVLRYLTPSLYNVTLIDDHILSPFWHGNRIFYKYRVRNLGDGNVEIRFRPRMHNTQTVKGRAFVHRLTGKVLTAHIEGEYDMVRFNLDVDMRSDLSTHLLPKSCTMSARFSFLGNRVESTYHAVYGVECAAIDSIEDTHDRLLIDSLRPDTLSEQEQRLWARADSIRESRSHDTTTVRTKNVWKDVIWGEIGNRLVNRHRGHFGTNDRGSYRIGPLLNPLYMGYSNRKGVYYRFDFRGNYKFSDVSDIRWRLKAGYSFKQRQFYFTLPLTYTFDARHEGNIGMEVGYGKHITNTTVVGQMKQKYGDDYTLWDEMDMERFRDSYMHIKIHYDITPRLGVSIGGKSHYRRAIDRENFIAMGLQTEFRSFAPTAQVDYLPIGERGPLLTVTYERGIKGILGSDHNYETVEADLSWERPLLLARRLSLRIGGGMYTTSTLNAYFLDYNNFREENLPGGWSDEWSGNFELLPRDWYNASKYYLRSNVTYESPMMMLAWVPWVGTVIEKERVYVSNLQAEGLKHYGEIGYGVHNRLFSAAFFMSFRELKYESCGVRFGFELFNNW